MDVNFHYKFSKIFHFSRAGACRVCLKSFKPDDYSRTCYECQQRVCEDCASYAEIEDAVSTILIHKFRYYCSFVALKGLTLKIYGKMIIRLDSNGTCSYMKKVIISRVAHDCVGLCIYILIQ